MALSRNSDPSSSPLEALAAGVQRLGSLGLRALLRLHRLILSPVIGPACRFEPSCSRYAEQAIERHGCLRGTAMAASRLLRCQPWSGPGGFDPVP